MDETGRRQPSGRAAARSARHRPSVSRPSSRATARILAAASLCLLAAGCTGADIGRSAAGWVPPGEERLSLVAAARPDRWRAVRYADDWQAEEYARVRAADLQLEYLDLAAEPGSPVALAASFDLARAVALFRRNRAGVSAWGELSRVEKPGGTLFYRPYHLGERACFGFEGTLARRGEDPLERPLETLLGYGCADAGLLTAARIETILDGIGIGRAASPARLPALPPARTALDFARGEADPDQGLASFPLLLARRYTLADAGEVPESPSSIRLRE